MDVLFVFFGGVGVSIVIEKIVFVVVEDEYVFVFCVYDVFVCLVGYNFM